MWTSRKHDSRLKRTFSPWYVSARPSYHYSWNRKVLLCRLDPSLVWVISIDCAITLPGLTYLDNTVRLRFSLQCVQGSSPLLEWYTTSRARSFRVCSTYRPSVRWTNNRSVKVTTVITGGVKSRIARTDRDLPPNSLYRPIDPEYQRRVKYSQESAMPHEDYARSVASQILFGPWPWRWLWPSYRRYIWEGHRSSLIKFLNGGWLWYGLFDRVFTRIFALWKLKRIN